MTRDHLPPAARAAHDRMLEAFDAFAQGVLEREWRAMAGRLQEAGGTPEMAAQLGMSKAAACRLINGKDGSANGWFVKGKRPAGRMGRSEGYAGDTHPMYRSEQITFRHVDGRLFKGTQHDLHIVHGVSKSMACRLARGQFRCAKGWYVEGKPPAKIGRGAAWKIKSAAQYRLV